MHRFARKALAGTAVAGIVVGSLVVGATSASASTASAAPLFTHSHARSASPAASGTSNWSGYVQSGG
ncbi:MAG TPA: hypothetical protein VHZ97_27185, partial [Pseudonocardiaceae bacterium]|nr:hypothetical protein [Pseudonocardiaceae bacterium]